MCFFSLKREWMYEVPRNRLYMLESVTFGREKIKEWDKYKIKIEKWGVECTGSKTTGKECGQRKLQKIGREWRTGRERMWEMKILVQKKEREREMFLGNLYDEWNEIGRYDVLREMGDSCEWAYWMWVRRGGSNCRSIIIELLNGRAYCVGRWDYGTGSDSCSDEWWRCKKMGTRQTDLLPCVTLDGGVSATDF